MAANNDKAGKGKLGEDYTADYLMKNGYQIIARNYRKPCGEIDIIAVKDGFIAFVEVKTRKYRSLVSGIEAVNFRKKGKIIATADYYLAENGMEYQPRYDIAEVTVSNTEKPYVIAFNYCEDAFDTTGYETQF
ncbi:MAG: YraN family protein [Ruminococcaceae bacterium]|nr:YraN family protein [Oscillospiraceae bacterium]